MATDLRSIPDEVKWKLAAQCAARLPLMYEHVFRPVAGETYDEHEQEIWVSLAGLSLDIARSLQLPIGTAPEIAESLRTVNAILFGPDFKGEVIELGEDRSVIVIRRCPFLVQAGATGPADGVFHRCMAFTLSSQNALNPGYSSRFVRAMCMGDRQCEIKIEAKGDDDRKSPGK